MQGESVCSSKAFSNKKCNSRICILKTPTLDILRMNFLSRIFSGVYHPQDTRDEKVSLVLPCGEH